jgi:1,2-dihydroxy-3-keto-5-methylthiopentene dioxygenase
MSALSIYNENGQPVEAVIRDYDTIAARLAELGVQFERWQATEPLAVDAEQAAVLDAYQNSIDQLNKQYGFQSVDVVTLRPDNPKKCQRQGIPGAV